MREGPRTTGELSKELPELSRFGVMQHLSVLESAGLVLSRREGRRRLNFVNPVPLREMYERWVSRHSSRAAETAQHLKRYAEQKHEEVQRMDTASFRLVKIELEMRINAPRERVFAALTTEYGNWWPHRFKPDSTCYCDARPGGEIGERFADGGGAIYGYIVYLDPGVKLVTSGMGALARGHVGYGVETLEDDGEGTLYKRSMTLWGDVPPEIEVMFREGSRQLMEDALRGYLESGKVYVPPAGSED